MYVFLLVVISVRHVFDDSSKFSVVVLFVCDLPRGLISSHLIVVSFYGEDFGSWRCLLSEPGEAPSIDISFELRCGTRSHRLPWRRMVAIFRLQQARSEIG